MRFASRTLSVLAALSTVTALTLAIAAPASAAPTAKKPTVPTAAIALPTAVYAHDEPTVTVTVSGASTKSPVTVNWGDGRSQTRKGTCTVDKARKSPARCSFTVEYTYWEAGAFTVAVSSLGRQIGTTTVQVLATPQPWTPPADWAQPSGWSLLGARATYIPCQTVDWYYDRTGESPDRNTMHDDIVAGLALLSAETGLTFTETTDPAQADLTFDWQDLAAQGWGGAEGLGGGANGEGEVSFAVNGDWTVNHWSGLGMVTREWDEGGYHWTWTLPGRGWLVIHETMHALGMGHIADPTQVMNPISYSAAFGAGDLDGLHTMYKNQQCPAVPYEQQRSSAGQAARSRIMQTLMRAPTFTPSNVVTSDTRATRGT